MMLSRNFWRTLFGFFVCICLQNEIPVVWAAPIEPHSTRTPQVLIVGVTEFALAEDRAALLDALQRAASTLPADYELRYRELPVPELERSARAGEVDLVLGSAGLVQRLSDAGAKPIVSTIGPGAVNANQNEGSAFLVRKDRTDLETIEDLALTHLIANRPSGFSGYLIAMGEIASAGHDPERFFSQETFVGEQGGLTDIARTVRFGLADVGILRLCAWEELQEREPETAADLRILAPQKSTSACVHSTALYPAHTLAALPHVSPEAVTAVTLAFLQMPETPYGRRWAVATDFLSIDRLYRALKIGPYRYLREPVWKRFLTEYLPFILLFLGVAALFVWQFENTKRLLEKRTREVRTLVEKEAEQEKRLLFLERNTMVSQLSSMLAHELHQPLAAIRLYAKGVRKLLGQAEENDDVREALEGISEEALRAKEIVERVRAYARNRRSERSVVSLDAILDAAISHFQSGTHRTIVLDRRGDRGVFVSVSPLEMELVFVNLLKNAREAALHGSTPAVSISVRRTTETLGEQTDTRVEVDVSDNGPDVTDETLARLTDALSSEKPEGLGLGLGIARNILEQHGGTLRFTPNRPAAGLTATVTLAEVPHPKIDS